VLITHNHRDHLDPWTISRLIRPSLRPPLGNADLAKHGIS
jgi:L-ascorbate metabolism protein UlaG (beta-lactamase superfamily)